MFGGGRFGTAAEQQDGTDGRTRKADTEANVTDDCQVLAAVGRV